MLIKKKLRKEKKREEDIHAYGEEEIELRKEKKRKKGMLVIFT